MLQLCDRLDIETKINPLAGLLSLILQKWHGSQRKRVQMV
jgi:hypothetical protein